MVYVGIHPCRETLVVGMKKRHLVIGIGLKDGHTYLTCIQNI